MHSNEIKTPIKRKTVQITLTEACNLNCRYCYKHNKDTRTINIETARNLIDTEFHSNDDFNEIAFDFHGGEIALEFDLLKDITEWMWSQSWEKPYICYSTTNGTLIHGEIQKWFLKNSRRYVLGLSLDGIPKAHDINRSDSYDKIDIPFFLKTWPEQTVKATVSPESLPYLYDSVRHLDQLGFKFHINLAYGELWTASGLLDIYASELTRIINFYLNNPTKSLPNMISMHLLRLGHEVVNPDLPQSSKWCGCGTGMRCYDVDGRQYPCQAFLPSTNLFSRSFEGLNFFDDALFDNASCLDCPILSVCPTCHGDNHVFRQSVDKRDPSLCYFRKLEALATSFIYGRMLLNYKNYSATKGFSPSDVYCWIEGIKAVQSSFDLIKMKQMNSL